MDQTINIATSTHALAIQCPKQGDRQEEEVHDEWQRLEWSNVNKQNKKPNKKKTTEGGDQDQRHKISNRKRSQVKTARTSENRREKWKMDKMRKFMAHDNGLSDLSRTSKQQDQQE